MNPKPHRAAPRARQRAPDLALPRSRTVLLVIDIINPLDFPGAEDLAAPALQAADAIAELKRTLTARGVPVIYVNDNFGHWRSNFHALLARCRSLKGSAPARLVKRSRRNPVT